MRLISLLAALVTAGALGYYFLVVREHLSGSGSSGGGSSDGGSSLSPTSTRFSRYWRRWLNRCNGWTERRLYITIRLAGWYYDPNDPYNNNVLAQSYTMPLNHYLQAGHA